MKTLKKQAKLIALIISVLMLFQSCKVYHSDSVSLQQASQEFKRTKIQTYNNEVLKFRGIKSEDTQYYGVKKVKGEIVNIPLDENYIKSVKLENKTMSIILTIALPIGIIVVAALVFQDSFKWKDTGTLDFSTF